MTTCNAILAYVQGINYDPKVQEVYERREVEDYCHDHPAARAAAEEVKDAEAA